MNQYRRNTELMFDNQLFITILFGFFIQNNKEYPIAIQNITPPMKLGMIKSFKYCIKKRQENAISISIVNVWLLRKAYNLLFSIFSSIILSMCCVIPLCICFVLRSCANTWIGSSNT